MLARKAQPFTLKKGIMYIVGQDNKMLTTRITKLEKLEENKLETQNNVGAN